jgi:addiction module RelB/DinJ family antitoxin
MAQTASVFARVEPEVKEQAEQVLNQLGIPMSNAIGLFLRQVAMRRGIPFDVKLPERTPLAYGALSEAEFDAEMEKGFRDLSEGRISSAKDVSARIRKDYGL